MNSLSDEQKKDLWEQAMQPETVDAMYESSINDVWGDNPDLQLTGREIVQRAFYAGLERLIGPNPNGGDDAK